MGPGSSLSPLAGQSRSRGWLLDEKAHARRDQADPCHVGGASVEHATDPGPDVELLRDLGLDGQSTFVDMGAGAGRMALAVAGICRRVVAVDISPEMVELVRRAAQDSSWADRIECVQAGFLSYRHSGQPADFVYSRNSLHHLPDFWKAVALRQIAGMLRPGGVLRLRDLVFSVDLGEVDERVGGWLEAAGREDLDGWGRGELERHLRDEFSTFSWVLEPMLERAGFDLLEASYSDSGMYAAYTCSRL